MKAFLACCFVFLCAHSFYGAQGCGTTYNGWDTSFGNSFKMECKTGESMYNIQSVHNDKKEDRVWGYHCRQNNYITTTCEWSLPNGQFVNGYDADVDHFICPGEGYMVGMYAGRHHSHYNDRRFDFKCCHAKPGLGQTDCKWTSYVNSYDNRMDYSAPSGYYIAGAYSTHNNHYEDRKWKFYICR